MFERSSWVRWMIVAGIVLASTAVAALAEGTARRARVEVAPARSGSPWETVPDAAGAFRRWRAAGVHGRSLVVFSGRWARVKLEVLPATAPADLARGGEAAETVDRQVTPESALLAAALGGLVREITVVLPPAGFAGLRELREGRGAAADADAISAPFHAYSRRFVLPTARLASAEPVLVLVEPSWFQEGAPAVDRWLAERGLRSDLALIERGAPGAADAQRAAAETFAAALGARGGEAP